MKEKAIDHINDNNLKNNSILKIENLSIAFGGLKAIDDLTFEIKKNEIFGLIGPNGAGKTTVFNCITQFYQPDSGKVLFRVKEQNKPSGLSRFFSSINRSYEEDEVINLVNMPVHDIISLGIVRTFQNLELIKELSVIDNVLVGGHVDFMTSFLAQSFRTRKAKREETRLRKQAVEILKFIGLDNIKNELVLGQPYGILKKIELARTLMSNPKLIILDEPAAGLNDHETEKLADIIREIRDKFNCSVLLVEHDMKLVMGLCERICAISFGKRLAIGTPDEIQNNKDVQEAYLGKDDE